MAQSSAGSHPGWVGAVVLTGLCLLIVSARLHTFDEPLERDITTYAIIAHEMLQGRELYVDLWDHKPPAVHLTFLMAEAVAGFGAASVYLLGVGAAIVTLFGIYLAGRLYDGRRSTGLWAAAFWTLIASDMQLQANQPNVEVFMNACLVWAFVALLKSVAHPERYGTIMTAGTLLALASLYKPIAVFVAATFGLAMVGLYRLERHGGYLSAFRCVAVLALPGLVGWVAVAIYFQFQGGFREFYDAVFAYNRFYSGSPAGNLVAGLHLSRLVPEFLYFLAPLVLLLIAGLAAGWRARRAAWLLLIAYITGTQLAVAAPGFFYPHYYQLWLPVLAVGGAWSIAALNQALRHRYLYTGNVLGTVALVILALYAAVQYRTPPEQWSQNKYGNQFVMTKAIAGQIDRVLGDEESFYEWGAETGLYFYSRRSPPTGVFYHYPLLSDWTGAGELAARVVRQLEQRPPELVILNRRILPPQQNERRIIIGGHPVLDWIGRRYRLLPGVNQQGALVFLARADSRLYRAFAAGDGPRSRPVPQ